MGPMRHIVVQIECASNVLVEFSRWLFLTWVPRTPKRVRKVWSHYGAIGSDERPFSGLDPGNRVYAFAAKVMCVNTALTNAEY